MSNKAKKSLIQLEPISKRLITARFQTRLVKVTIRQCYAPTVTIIQCYVPTVTIIQCQASTVTIIQCYASTVTIIQCYAPTVTIIQCYAPTVTVIQCYAPTNDHNDENKDKFYNQLQSLINKTPFHDLLLVMGDFNAKLEMTISVQREPQAPMALGSLTKMVKDSLNCAKFQTYV